MSETKHTNGDLEQMQSLPLDAKIAMTKRRIRDWYDFWDGNVYLAFSGGKDSTVLKHLIDSIYDDVPAVFVDTGLEYPEIRDFAKAFAPDAIWLRPEKNFKKVILENGYPVFSKEVSERIYYGRRSLALGDESQARHYLYGERVSPVTGEIYTYRPLSKAALDFALNTDIPAHNKCCTIMKKRPCAKYERETGRKRYLATMADESAMRKQAWIRTGCNAYEGGHVRSAPMSFWTEQDVLQYIKRFNVPYCSIYGEIIEDENGALHLTGEKRTGCIFCMYGAHLDPEPTKFQKLKLSHPKQWAYCMKPVEEGGLGLARVLDQIGVPYDIK